MAALIQPILSAILLIAVFALRDALSLRSSARPHILLRLLIYFTTWAAGLTTIPIANRFFSAAFESKFWLVLTLGHGLRWFLVHGFAAKPSRNGLIWITTTLPSLLQIAALLSLRSGNNNDSILAISPVLTMALLLGLPIFKVTYMMGAKRHLAEILQMVVAVEKLYFGLESNRRRLHPGSQPRQLSAGYVRSILAEEQPFAFFGGVFQQQRSFLRHADSGR